jgi:hypothetical protein
MSEGDARRFDSLAALAAAGGDNIMVVEEEGRKESRGGERIGVSFPAIVSVR